MLPDVHAPFNVVEENVVVPFKHIAWLPLNVPATGAVVITITLLAVSFEHPPVPDTIYLNVSFPDDDPFTLAESLLLLAIDALELLKLQAPALLFPVTVYNTFVALEHIESSPDIVPATGGAVTVTVLVAVAFEQPPVPVTV